MTEVLQQTPAKSAIVTGGGTGIGASIARSLTDDGWQVLICGRRREQLAEVSAVTGAVPFAVDITAPEAAAAIVAEAVERFGRLDGLVLNAAVAHGGSFAEHTDEMWQNMLDTNLLAAARLVRSALPQLVGSQGSILGIASLAALRASSLLSGYSATKAGLGMMLQSIAVEYGKNGVRANLLCPGLIRTEMSASSLSRVAEAKGLSLDQAYGLATRNVPLRRSGEPSEVGGVARFLLSPEASYITGAVLPVDGGATAVDVAALIYDPDPAA